MIKIKPFNTIKKPEIIDMNNDNYYGIIMFSTKTIEAFQDLSGMIGPYTKEYQFHFYAAVGRIESKGQILDVAIPLLLYNYEQEVGGTSVAFHLNDVLEAAEKYEEKAIQLFKELQEQKLFEELVDMGFIDWTITKFNNIHVHPDGVNRFSGTDYKKTYDNPGVCFPLRKGENEPIFSGIIQHKERFAEIIHMEYRIMNSDKNENAIYEHGRCMTIIKGYTPPPKPVPEPKIPGPIDQLFDVTPPPPPKPAKEKERKDYVLKDRLSGKEGNTMANEIMSLWKNSTFVPAMEIDKDNIKLHTYKRTNTYEYKYEYGQDLFGYASHRHKKDMKKQKKSHKEKLKKLQEIGYGKDELKDMTIYEISELYDIEMEALEDEFEAEKKESSFLTLATELVEAGIISQEEVLSYSLEDLKKIYKTQLGY